MGGVLGQDCPVSHREWVLEVGRKPRVLVPLSSSAWSRAVSPASAPFISGSFTEGAGHLGVHMGMPATLSTWQLGYNCPRPPAVCRGLQVKGHGVGMGWEVGGGDASLAESSLGGLFAGFILSTDSL